MGLRHGEGCRSGTQNALEWRDTMPSLCGGAQTLEANHLKAVRLQSTKCWVLIEWLLLDDRSVGGLSCGACVRR